MKVIKKGNPVGNTEYDRDKLTNVIIIIARREKELGCVGSQRQKMKSGHTVDGDGDGFMQNEAILSLERRDFTEPIKL